MVKVVHKFKRKGDLSSEKSACGVKISSVRSKQIGVVWGKVTCKRCLKWREGSKKIRRKEKLAEYLELKAKYPTKKNFLKWILEFEKQ